jgi:hypothetical protein
VRYGQLGLVPLHTSGAQLGLPADPAGTTVQLPRLPARLQASQLAPHGVLQQKPSAQKPLMHSPPPAQAEPFDFLASH